MPDFPINTLHSAPEGSKAAMQSLEKAFGFLPNLIGAMATSPVLIDSLVGLFGRVHGGSFTESQIQTVLLTDAIVNKAAWAVALHTHLALENGIARADVDAIRRGAAPSRPELAAMSKLARALIERRGHVTEAEKSDFFGAGYTPQDLLEVIAIVAASTITNYTANVTKPPIEAGFAQFAPDAA